MATDAKLFLSFYVSQTAALTAVGAAAQLWSQMAKPVGVYHYRGVSTLDGSLGPTLTASGNPFLLASTRLTSSGAFTLTGYDYGYGAFSGATSVTYALWDSQKGYQLGIQRSAFSITNEVYISFDWRLFAYPNSSLAGYEPTAEYKSLFRWGDVEIRFKSSTWGGSSHSIVLAIRNNGSEVATVTIPGCTNTTYQFLRLHVKLDATTGLIDCECNGNGQSVPYTGQNTVTTTSLATAAFVYVGPIVADDNAVQSYCAAISNVYVSTTGYAAGRPMSSWAEATVIASDNTLTGWVAEGTGATTLTNALSSATDAKAARGYGTGSSALLNLSSIASYSAGLRPEIISLEVHANRLSNRDLTIAKRVKMGFSLSGVTNMGTYASTIYLPTDSVSTPPASNYLNILSEFIMNPTYTISDWANIKVRLETV